MYEFLFLWVIEDVSDIGGHTFKCVDGMLACVL